MAKNNQQLKFLDIKLLQPNPFQPRNKIQPEDVEELTDSIKQYGILEPLIIAQTPAGYQIIAGERRWRAAKAAGLTEVPVLIKKTTPRGMLEMAIIENVQRIDLNSIERAQAFKQLMRDFKYTLGDVARKVSKSSPYVSNSIRLLALPDAIKDGIVGKLISEGHGRALASLDDKKVQIELYKKILKETASVRRAEELVRYEKEKIQTEESKSHQKVEAQVSPSIVKKWQDQIERYLKTKPQLKLVRSRNQTRLTVTLKGDQDEAKQDLEKIMTLITKND
jgi:ParB family transcriptional regulator, chromosome partitioning protein